MINPMTACLVFILTAFMDALHAVYTKAISEEKPALAATAGSFIYIVSAYAVIQYTQNWIYVLFMVAGSWVGTYLTMKYKKKIKTE